MGDNFGKMIVNAILGAIAGQWIATIKTEFEVAKVELKFKSRQLGTGAALVAAGAMLAFWMLAVLIAAAILGLAVVLEPWAAALIVAGALLLIILILVGIGARKIKKNKDLWPAASIERVKKQF